MKRAKITLILYIILVLAMIVLSIKLSNNSWVLLILLVLMMGGFTFNRMESFKIAEKVSYYFENKDYDKLIEILKASSEESIVYMNCLSSLASLTMIYMLNNNVEEAKALINKYNFLKNHRGTCYINLILAIDDENLELAKEYNSRLQSYRSGRYLAQKEAANILIELVETGKYDEKIEELTQYQLVKDICKKYKK